MTKTKISIAMILILALLVPVIVQTAPAAAIDIPVYLMVHAEPDPVGVGQTVYISLFFTKPIPNQGGQVYTDLTVNLIKPDGTNQTFGPYNADTTGGVGGIEFVPSVTGNYTVQGIYPGQTLTTGGRETILPAMSEPAYFTVQEDPIQGYQAVPLPTEYWSRPIYSTNYEWSQLGGNWWGLGKPSFTDTGGYDGQGNNFNPYTQAPNSAHIQWVKPTAFGGQVGGPISGDQESQYTSTSILYRQFEPIILNGIMYYKLYPNVPTTVRSAGGTPGWNAVDLRTGELVWHKETNDTLAFGWNMQFHTIQEYGTQAFLVAIAPGNIWRLYDPLTGHFIANITGVASTTATGLVETRDENTQGAVYIYSTNGTTGSQSLTMWNSTKCLMSNPSASTIRPSGNIAYSRGYQWSVPIPTNITVSGKTYDIYDRTDSIRRPALSIAARTNDVILLRAYGETLDLYAAQFGEDSSIEVGMSALNGSLLWGPFNRTLPRFHEVGVIAAGEGYYVLHDKDSNDARVYSLVNGQQIGGVIDLPGNALSTLSRGGAIAYGKCYIWDFGGYVNAIDLATGTLDWTFKPQSAGYDTPYGIYPIWHFGSHSIADGKLFLSEGRMYDPPLFAGAQKLAINCTDGSLVWSVLGTYAREPSAIADGYLVGWNSYDAQIYVFGKGQTSTTAAIATNVVPFGSSVLVTGTVMDEAPGTKDSDRTARFPQGVPAVSDESQSAWMEYVYMQQPKPTNATGVLVELFVIDANNNYRSIGTTTTDSTGFYSLSWIPDIEGKYTVYAKFAGSESYWPSQATTAFAVDEPIATPTPQPTQPPSMADEYFLPAIVGLFVAIILVGVVMVLMMRKRP